MLRRFAALNHQKCGKTKNHTVLSIGRSPPAPSLCLSISCVGAQNRFCSVSAVLSNRPVGRETLAVVETMLTFLGRGHSSFFW